MDYSAERWESILENYDRWYGDPEVDILDWYPIGPFEIRLSLSNGRERIYNDELGTIQNAELRDRAEEVYSKERFKREFSTALRSRMQYCGMTQEMLAYECDLTQTTISNYLSGDRMPNVYVAYQMALALNCTIWDLFKFTDRA